MSTPLTEQALKHNGTNPRTSACNHRARRDSELQPQVGLVDCDQPAQDARRVEAGPTSHRPGRLRIILSG